MGSGRKQPIALLDMGDGGLPDEGVRASLEAQLREVNGQLENHQKLDHIVVCNEAWDIENDFLTPSLKLRRNVLEAHYQKTLEHARLEQPVLWESEL
jgi:long-subunit acyl-CoA synthetase (AMP-forming)